MSGPLYLILLHARYYWGRTVVLVLCLLLAGLLPAIVAILLRQFSRQIVARADATPAVVGHAGSGLDLALHATHFRRAVERTIPWSEAELLNGSGLGRAIPLYARFTARGQPLVGTTPEYFSFRNLDAAEGRMFFRIGECVVGDRVAKRLQLRPGDSLLSDRENVLDIAGLYPLKMRVTGVLARSGTPDDEAVFTDLKTAWIIAGIGHGHQDLSGETDPGLVLQRDGRSVVASAAVLPYTEITEENIASFHFHGDEGQRPLTAVIADCPDRKSATILEGRYPSGDGSVQLVVPRRVVDDLLGMLFRTERFFQAHALLVAGAMALMMGLVMWLSVQLRRREMRTLFLMGGSRGVSFWLQAGEWFLIFGIAAVLLAGSVWLASLWAGALVQRMIVG